MLTVPSGSQKMHRPVAFPLNRRKTAIHPAFFPRWVASQEDAAVRKCYDAMMSHKVCIASFLHFDATKYSQCQRGEKLK